MEKQLFKREQKLNVRELALSNGMSYPSDVELVMMILGSGTKRTPIEFLAEKVLAAIDRTNPPTLVGELLKIEGIGSTKALAIAAALELGRRLNRRPESFLNEPADVVPYVQHYALQSVEHFICVSMNGAREILNIHVAGVGEGNIAVIKPAEIFSDPLKHHASAVVLCHNHPSGLCSPSPKDEETTKAMVRAASLLGIVVLDHIILTRNGYFSFLEHGMLPIPREGGTMSK